MKAGQSSGVVVIMTAAVGALMGAGATWAVGRTDPAPAVPTVNERALDRAVPACGNFYRHACGGFLAAAAPSERRPEISLLGDDFDARLQRALDRLFREPAAPGSELARLKTFYESCRGSIMADAAGDGALRSWLARIEQARTRPALAAVARDLDAIGVEPFFVYDVAPDPAAWRRWHGSLGPANTFGDAAVVQAMFVRSGLSAARAARDAAAVAAIAAALDAARKVDGGEGRFAEKGWAQLAALAPEFDWAAYRRLIGARGAGRIAVPSPAYVRAVGTTLRTATPEALRAYLRWRLLLSLRGELPRAFAPVLRTLPVNLRGEVDDPDKRCRDATVRGMGVAFSRQFATRILGVGARAQARQLSEEIRTGVIAAVERNDWLSPIARVRTVDKLRRMDLHIGFPDRWPATGTFPLHEQDFLGNVLAARRFEQRQKWARAGELRNRAQWQEQVFPWVGRGMASARLVIPNGFPDAYSNALVMTAAFLMPPRFAGGAAPEANFATYGAVFAHELTHVLENHGDGADGRPSELWTPADIAAHDRRRQCVVDQADAFVPASGLTNPGERQVDENVADISGLRLATAALAARLGPVMAVRGADGRTPAQRFFYRYAQQYCTAQTPERLAAGVARDGHGPAEFRVNGPLTNLPAFAEAFGCQAGDAMVRPIGKMCRVW